MSRTPRKKPDAPPPAAPSAALGSLGDPIAWPSLSLFGGMQAPPGAANGRANGHATNGHAMNGHATNGHASNGAAAHAPPAEQAPAPPLVEAPPATAWNAPPGAVASAPPTAVAANRWNQLVAERAAHARGNKRVAMPQGETQLVHAWLQVLYVQGAPPNACTIWFQRIEPAEGSYGFYLRGEACMGEMPDRGIYDAGERARRQRGIRERFNARIRALMPDGSMEELGGGEIEFPPAVAEPAQPPWNGAAHPNPWSAQQQPPPFAYGAPYGAYGPGIGAGYPPPWWAMHAPAAAPAPPPPPAVQSDPLALAAWESLQASNRALQESQARMSASLLERALAPAPPAAAPAPAMDPWAMFDRFLSFDERMRARHTPAAAAPERVRTVDGQTVFFDKEGDVDVAATGIMTAVKESKALVSGIMQARAATASGLGGMSAPPGSQLKNGAK